MSLLCNTVQSPGGWPLCLRGRAVVKSVEEGGERCGGGKIWRCDGWECDALTTRYAGKLLVGRELSWIIRGNTFSRHTSTASSSCTNTGS